MYTILFTVRFEGFSNYHFLFRTVFLLLHQILLMKNILFLAGMLNGFSLWAQHQVPVDTLFTNDSEVPGRQYLIIRDEDKKTIATGSLMNGVHDGTWRQFTDFGVLFKI